MATICWKETLERALDVMDFDQIKELWREYADDACTTEYAFGCPYYVTDKESEDVADFIWDYMEEHYPKELNEWIDAGRDEADALIENW